MKRFFILIFLISWTFLFARGGSADHIRELARAAEDFHKLEGKTAAAQFFTLEKKLFPDSSDFDQLYYDLNFTITTSPQNLEGLVTGVFESNINGLSQIKLNFDSREGTSPWQFVNVTGNVNSWTLSNWVLRINLDQVYNAGDTFTITVHYSGVPRAQGLKGFGFDYNSFGDLVISTLSEPYQAQTWWPCKDDPSDKLDSVRISVNVPDNFIVASNGLLESVTSQPNNTKTYVWKEKYPITTYLVSLAISNYYTFSDSFEYSPGQFMPIDYFVYPQNASIAPSAFQKLPDMLTAFSNLYGLYPFVDEKYGHAEFEWGGAMEHQTCTSIGVVSTNWESIYAHELSHQWFGDLVTCHDWHHIWMNEGFATYSEALWVESEYGSYSYHAYIDYSLGSMSFWAIDPIYRYTVNDPWYIFSRTVYSKGMWVLHMLRHLVGDSTFFEIMHDYPNDPAFAFKDVTTEQFRDYCEGKSGMDLDWFFYQWIYEPYFPVYHWGYQTHQIGGQDYLYLQIDQKQSLSGYSHLYKMPIDVVIRYSDGSRDSLVVWDSLETQSFDIPISGTVQQVYFDPDNWVLKTAQQVPVTYLNPPVNKISVFRLYQNYPNPFNSTTRIPFSLDTSGNVKIEIFDATGRKVRTLVDGFYSAGTIVTWDGMDDRLRPVASGVYLYRIQFNGRVQARKMLLIR